MSKNSKYIMVGSILICLVFFSCFAWIFNEEYQYDKEHPIVCGEQGVIKEVVSIDGAYATLKLQNEEVIQYQISHSQMVKNSFTKQYSSRQVYSSVKPGDTLCLKYVRK